MVFARVCCVLLACAVSRQGSAQERRPDQPLRELLTRPEETVAYESFEEQTRQLYPWVGDKVAFLTRSADLDVVTMTRLVEVFDGVYDFYQAATGRTPRRAKHLDGKLTIAEEPETCGAGCGYLGYTGIELTPEAFEELYQKLRVDGRVDQALPYEFGRNFWFYADRLEYAEEHDTGSITTGYAVLMRFWALEAVGCRVARFHDAEGDAFVTAVEGLVDAYEGDRRSTWKRTLRKGRGVDNALGLGATDLFASFLMRARRESAHADFTTRIWRYAGHQPVAKSTEDAVDNLVVAASLAAQRDLSDLFKKRWKFPQSAAAKRRITEGLESGVEPNGNRPGTLLSDGGVGSFVFDTTSSTSVRPVRVWYSIPERRRPSTPILFVMHGMSRTAERYRDAWADHARNEKLVLLVPEFSQQHYPGSRMYNLGNRFDVAGQPEPSEAWSFTAIERIFDHVRQELDLRVDDYAIYGHSAGAQFVHRMVLSLPESRIRLAVAANAGWYTMPSEEEEWPYGLGSSGIDTGGLEQAFARKLCVLLGERDVDERGANLRRTPEAMRQGRHRLERGHAFFEAARDFAREQHWPFRWEVKTVPGVGHSNSGMQPAAAKWLDL